MSDRPLNDTGQQRNPETGGPVGTTGQMFGVEETVNRVLEEEAGQWWNGPLHFVAYAQQQGFGFYIDQLESAGLMVDGSFPNDDAYNKSILFLQEKGLYLPAPPDVTDGGGRGYGSGSGVSTAQQIEGMMANIRAAALAWNVRLPDANVRQLATTAVNGNYNNQQVLNMIGGYVVATEGQTDAVLQGQVGEAINRAAADYGIRLSDATRRDYINMFVQGKESQESLLARMKEQAVRLYPSLAERFNKGETYEQIVSPYREIAAQVLEKAPAAFDFTSGALNKVATFNPDGKGERMMSVGEFSDYLRQTKSFGYEYTNQAQQKAYQVANSIAEMFGRV